MNSLLSAIYFESENSSGEDVQISFDEIANDLIIHRENDVRLHWHLKSLNIVISGQLATLSKSDSGSGHVQFQQLEFARFLRKKKAQKGYSGLMNRINNAGIYFYLLMLSAFFGLILLSYFFVLPWVAERAVDILPTSFDTRIGESLYEGITGKENIDSVQTKRLRDFASGIQFDSARTLRFSVIQSKEANAFALPDGNIIVYSGILPLLPSENALAALLSHEAAHVTQRHSMKLLAKNLAAYLLVSTLSSDVEGLMGTMAKNANILGTLSFSREYEEAADLEGLAILKRNKIDPKGMKELLESLSKEDSAQIPDFLSTHPVTEKRIQYVEDYLRNEGSTAQSDSLLQRIFLEIKAGSRK
ncbi:MAG: M48 family metallopeptidase [Bacteroidetes bacterium]|nr:M48 family metallopeptidase [Bacteroidota bacterium]